MACNADQRPGDPVVFLHAAVCDKRMWRHQVDAVADTHQAVAYDRRGFGESDTPQAAFSSVADLLPVLDSLNTNEPVILVGCSQGGRIALKQPWSTTKHGCAEVPGAAALTGPPRQATQQ